MKNNIGRISVDFNRTAVKLFRSLYKKYNYNLDCLPQGNKDNKYQELGFQYSNTLKQQLDEMAISIMDKYKAAIDEVEQFQSIVAAQINFYLREFHSKAGLL